MKRTVGVSDSPFPVGSAILRLVIGIMTLDAAMFAAGIATAAIAIGNSVNSVLNMSEELSFAIAISAIGALDRATTDPQQKKEYMQQLHDAMRNCLNTEWSQLYISIETMAQLAIRRAKDKDLEGVCDALAGVAAPALLPSPENLAQQIRDMADSNRSKDIKVAIVHLSTFEPFFWRAKSTVCVRE